MRGLKLAAKRCFDLSLLRHVVNTLAEQKPLEQHYHDHELTGDYAGFRECHIQPDWLLVYRVEAQELQLYLFRPGTHADLF